MSQAQGKLSRRTLFAGAGTAGAVATVASLMPAVKPLEQVSPEPRVAPAKGGGITCPNTSSATSRRPKSETAGEIHVAHQKIPGGRNVRSLALRAQSAPRSGERLCPPWDCSRPPRRCSGLGGRRPGGLATHAGEEGAGIFRRHGHGRRQDREAVRTVCSHCSVVAIHARGGKRRLGAPGTVFDSPINLGGPRRGALDPRTRPRRVPSALPHEAGWMGKMSASSRTWPSPRSPPGCWSCARPAARTASTSSVRQAQQRATPT